MDRKIRILSIDGGGIRGLIPAVILDYVENELQKKSKNPNARIADYFDFVAGTSTGGILSCFYLTPNNSSNPNDPISKYSAKQAIEFYSKKGEIIFNASKKHRWFGVRKFFNATKFSEENIEEIFDKEFGNLKFPSLLKPCLITAYNMKAGEPQFFKSASSESKAKDFYVKDVVRSTSAAPTYFSPAKIINFSNQSELINIDGGVFANNPSMCAYAECRIMNFDCLTKLPMANEMLFLSFGTGATPIELPNVKQSKKWGLVGWAKAAPEIMMDGTVDTVAYQMKNLFGNKTVSDNYLRIDVPSELKSGYSSDFSDASKNNIKNLISAGKETLNTCKKSLDNFINRLLEVEDILNTCKQEKVS